MRTSTTPRYSTRELQAAAAALAEGRFSPTTSRAGAPATIYDQPTQPHRRPDGTADEGEHRTESTPVETDPAAISIGSAPLVRVRAANAGAGASTIALALADVADAAGIRARVLDAATPAWSGLTGATVTELGADEGWRRGRRGAGVLIDRVDELVHIPAQVPSPRPAGGVDLTVLDAGWSMRELAASGADTWVSATLANVEVLVTRPHALALSQSEAALIDLEDQLNAGQVLVVVVGASRWSDRELASAGQLLRAAHRQDAVLFAPLLSAKTLPGLGPDPLPKQLTNPSQRLLERITTITGPLTANRT